MLFVGDDWAQDHHDVFLMSDSGTRLASRRLPEGLAGIAQIHDLVAKHVEDPGDVVIGIEKDRGLWVTALATAGYQVYAINPMAVARYRDRHSVSGAKSDAADAKLLADLVRTDRHNHRLLAGDSERADSIKVLARTHQNLIWMRARQISTLRASLLEYYPAALQAFPNLGDRDRDKDALAVLGRAPTPEEGARLSLSKIAAALKVGGRQYALDKRAREIQPLLRSQHLRAPATVTAAYGAATRATVAIVVELTHQIAAVETELAEHFRKHPDADIYLSLPGIGVILGARVLGEFGDDPNRFTDPKCRKNYAGTSPVTVASGQKRAVLARHVRNDRLYDSLDRWAFATLKCSPGSRAFYDHHRAAGDTHHQALRALANRLVGILHGCLRHHTTYNEDAAWAHRISTAA
ncbi:IS110 family transposase [Mycolicibacterium smegmatis]|uniref:Transposase IS116/IS110/IS902 family protein n=1 Tax=Mycolicibacterium smegmatis (strain MKD8) TaxID=1214915 RepID=A0A2U9PR97_MYCSE|nr:IS110 family transposase [Mycolicibacterium smegmatis]AWT54321.1 Transposase IS116/IS110/IS902 family protein [Mycolicibacterium smegmatis MKD8]